MHRRPKLLKIRQIRPQLRHRFPKVHHLSLPRAMVRMAIKRFLELAKSIITILTTSSLSTPQVSSSSSNRQCRPSSPLIHSAIRLKANHRVPEASLNSKWVPCRPARPMKVLVPSSKFTRDLGHWMMKVRSSQCQCIISSQMLLGRAESLARGRRHKSVELRRLFNNQARSTARSLWTNIRITPIMCRKYWIQSICRVEIRNKSLTLLQIELLLQATVRKPKAWDAEVIAFQVFWTSNQRKILVSPTNALVDLLAIQTSHSRYECSRSLPSVTWVNIKLVKVCR